MGPQTFFACGGLFFSKNWSVKEGAKTHFTPRPSPSKTYAKTERLAWKSIFNALEQLNFGTHLRCSDIQKNFNTSTLGTPELRRTPVIQNSAHLELKKSVPPLFLYFRTPELSHRNFCLLSVILEFQITWVLEFFRSKYGDSGVLKLRSSTTSL